MKLTKLLLGIMVTLLLVQGAAAELNVNKFTNEFSLSTTSMDGKACAGSQVSIPVKVENVGDIDAVFEINIESPLEDRFHVEGYEPEFELKKGESETRNVIADLAFDQTGQYDYTIKVTSTYGREKRLHRTLTVVQCQNIKIGDSATTQIVKPAELAKFSFTLENPTNFKDAYSISVGDHEEFTRLSEEEFSLAGGEDKQVFVYAEFPAEKWGDFDIPVTITSQENGMSKKLNLDLKIKRAYQFALNTKGSVDTCSKVDRRVPVTIQNKADVDNTYQLSLDAPGFARLSQDSVSLRSDETATVEVVMSPQDEHAGSYDFELTARSELGDLKTDQVMSVEVDNCYEHDITMPESATLICGQETFDVNVQNMGTKEADIRLSSDLPDWASLEKSMVSLNPAENTDVDMTVAPPCSDQSYKFTVAATHMGLTSLKKKAEMSLEVVTPQSANELSLPQKNFDLEHDQEELDIQVRNDGIREGRYRISMDSKFLTSELEQVRLSSGETKQLTLLVGNVSGLEPGEYLHDMTFALSGSNITYDATIGTDLKGPTLAEQFGSWLWGAVIESGWYATIGWCGWSTIILLLALVGLMATGMLINEGRIDTERFTVDYRTHFELLNVALLAVAIFGVVFFFSTFSTTADAFYQESSMNESPLFHEWKQGTEYRINLDRYFEDPDMDELTFTHSGSENVQVTINNGTAVLEPIAGWSGTEQVVFTATDTAGESDDSDPMTLRVLERRDDVSWVDVWLANCSQVNAFVMALIFLALFWLADKVEPRGRDYYFSKGR